MWLHVFLQFRRQPGKQSLAGTGFLLAACALILLSATTQTTTIKGNQIISQNWHPAYDLVVLPPQVHIPASGIVPPDFLQNYDGGISLQQYAQIKQIPGIEVAAPIAYLGYIQMPTLFITFRDPNLPTGFYQMQWTIMAFNGQRHLVETQESHSFYLNAHCTADGMGQIINVLTTLHIELGGCLDPTDPSIYFTSPDTGTFLLAAIDPQAEDQLVHLNRSINSGRPLTNQDVMTNDTRTNVTASAIPMLIQQSLPGRITLNGTFALTYQSSQTPEQIQAAGGLDYLTSRVKPRIIFNGSVPLVQNNPQRFSGATLQWNGQNWQRLSSPTTSLYVLDFSSAYTSTGLTYRPATDPNGNPAYTLVPTGTQGPEVTFRHHGPLTLVRPSGPSIFGGVTYTFNAIGSFASTAMAAQFTNPLNWLPENTYTSSPVITRFDAQGHPVNPTTLLPTTNSDSFVTQPPLALTTLQAAQQLKRGNIINAIRVRVAGVDQPDEQSWRRIQQVASAITHSTHLQVLITLGSSPRPTLVYVPGVQQDGVTVPSMGWVEERWIAIGAGIAYVQQLGTTQILLLSAVLALCLGYLVVAFSALVTAQRRDFAVLSALGWRPWQPARLFLMQALLLALGGGLVGLCLALLLCWLLGVFPVWLMVALVLPAMLVMALLSSCYPLWQLWRMRPADILRAGTISLSSSLSRTGQQSIRHTSSIPTIGGPVLRNLMRSRARSIITISSLFLSALLLVLMGSDILTLRQSLSGTLLGNFVLVQTAVPQLAGSILALLLTFLSVADVLLVQVRERRQEIGLLQALGWRAGAVQRMFIQEGLALALIGTIPGVLVSLWILNMQRATQPGLSSFAIAGGTTLLLLLLAMLATAPALRAIARMQVADVLRTE